jgi:hypothetical protein
MANETKNDQVTVHLANGLITARIRGQPTEGVLHDCQTQVIHLARESGIRNVLYDALDMEPPHFTIPWAQRALDEELGDVKLRRAVVVPNSKLAFLARLAFGDGDYRVFYEDMSAAAQWLAEETR